MPYFIIQLQYNSTFKAVLNEWKLFCEKPPKGFEKYFKPGSKPQAKDTKPESESSAKEAKETKGTGTGKTEPKPPPKPSTPPGGGQTGGSKPYDQWSFGLFGGTGSRLVFLN